MITIQDIIAKRKARWEERHDIEYDKMLVKAAVGEILRSNELRDEIVLKPYLLIEIAFQIVNKDRETVPFFLNEVQKDFIEKLETLGTSKPFFVLKGRQQGFTTLITAIQLSFCIVRKNFAGFTVADCSSNSQTIFNDKAKVVYERLPDELKPHEKFNSRNELFFDKLNSSWRIATATDQMGRSRTLNFIHFSEAAFYECDLSLLQAGVGEALTAGAIQIYETTANGFNQAKELWDGGTCHNLFYPWWRSNEYRSTEYEYIDTIDPWLIERIRFLELRGCDREQIAWYCKKYVGYIYKDTIKQEYPCFPEEAFLSSGSSLFDTDAINNRLALCSAMPPARVGYFTYKKEAIPIAGSDGTAADVEWRIKDIEFVDSRDGYIELHEEPRVKRDIYGEVTHKAPYVLGGDTAGNGQDYFTAKVICNLDGKTAATLHKQRMDEDLYAEQLYCLGKYYHDALIGIEINYSRQPTRILDQKFGYPNMYMREKLDGLSDKVIFEHGFETTRRTKPIIIGELVELIRNTGASIEFHIPTLKEMTTFVRKDNGSMEALEGMHDDLVMALAIAHFISKKQTHDYIEVIPEDNDFITENFNYEVPEGNSSYMSWEDF